MSPDQFFQSIRDLFPLRRPNKHSREEHYVLTRALYHYAQDQIAGNNWSELERVFSFVSTPITENLGIWPENAIRVMFLEEFDFKNQRASIEKLMGEPLLGCYRDQAKYLNSYSASELATRRANRNAFDREVFGPKQKHKNASSRSKPIEKLTLADLGRHPIWEFASDEEGDKGKDETWIRSVPAKQVPVNAYSQLVSADFTTPANRKLSGFMHVTTAGGEIEILPGAVIVARTLKWLVTPEQQDLDLFPLRYRLRAKISSETKYRTGIIDA